MRSYLPPFPWPRRRLRSGGPHAGKPAREAGPVDRSTQGCGRAGRAGSNTRAKTIVFAVNHRPAASPVPRCRTGERDFTIGGRLSRASRARPVELDVLRSGDGGTLGHVGRAEPSEAAPRFHPPPEVGWKLTRGPEGHLAFERKPGRQKTLPRAQSGGHRPRTDGGYPNSSELSANGKSAKAGSARHRKERAAKAADSGEGPRRCESAEGPYESESRPARRPRVRGRTELLSRGLRADASPGIAVAEDETGSKGTLGSQ